VMPGTSHRLADDQSFGQRTAVMAAGRANREEFIAAAREQHRLVADIPADRPAVGYIRERDATREVRTRRLGLLNAHLSPPPPVAMLRLLLTTGPMFKHRDVR